MVAATTWNFTASSNAPQASRGTLWDVDLFPKTVAAAILNIEQWEYVSVWER